MNWTTEYPTQKGAYWIRNYLFKSEARRGEKPTPGPCLVDVNAPYDDFYYFGVETPEHRTMLVSAEWFGPIRPPRENDIAPLIDAAVHILTCPPPPLPTLPPGAPHNPGVGMVEPIPYSQTQEKDK